MHRNLALATILLVVAPLAARAQDTLRVSVDPKGNDGDAASESGRRPATSGGDKALVVFTSHATNLVPKDTNGVADVFLLDLAAGTTTRIVSAFSGGEIDGDCANASITPDGRYVVFQSAATDLVKSDTNSTTDVFLLDRAKGFLERVSVDSSGAEADDSSTLPSISDDGRWVAFSSRATNLVASDTNQTTDIFLRDRNTDTTVCVSVNPGGAPANGPSPTSWLSSDGSKIAFDSSADDLVANDTNNRRDVFVRDLATGVTTRASVNASGFELNDDSRDSSLSADGAFVCFSSQASNLHRDVSVRAGEIYVKDLATGEVWLASRGIDGARAQGSVLLPVMLEDAATGEPVVAFWTSATNFPDDGNDDFDLFAVRPWSGISQCLSVDSDGVDTLTPGGSIRTPGISPDGDAFFFGTDFDGLDPNDGNGEVDVYRRGLQWTLPAEFGTGLAGSGGYVPHLSALGGSCEAGRWSIAITDGLPQAPGHLWVGFGRTNGIQLFGGTFYLDFAQPVIPLPIRLLGPAGVHGAGTLDLDGANVEDLGQFSIFLQCTLLDSGAPRGVSISNALEIAIDA